MSNQKSGPNNSRWGKTSRFVYKNTTKKNQGISKEEKERFYATGTLPKFKCAQRSEKWLQKKFPAIETDLLQEATTVLNKVKDHYGTDGSFIEAAYGKRISINRASEVIHNYLVEHGIDGMMSVHFSSELDCSGKMQWTGPMTKYNKPERRNFSMWVKTTNDNFYFRETGILNLTNHEIGTHFFRAVNDGLQPWFSNRQKFGLDSYKSQALKDTEEGLACLNTAFEAKVKYLWGPAMLYYTACMSLEMNFKELFDHLVRYVADPDIRWKWVVRVKRGRTANQLGGNGKDQCYFRGAVNILRNLDSINFDLLYAGKITVEDQPRVQRIARLGCVKTPYFLKDMKNYKRYMRNMLKVNGISKAMTSIIREPELKLTAPKTPRARESKFNNKNGVSKTPRTLMLEARQRIMSTQLLCKPKRRTLDDSSHSTQGTKIFSFSSEALTIEHESDTEEEEEISFDPLDGDKGSVGETKSSHASAAIPEGESSHIVKVQAEVLVSGRRRSDSCCTSAMKSSHRTEERENSPNNRCKSPWPDCDNSFIMPNQTEEKDSKPQKTEKRSPKFPSERAITPSSRANTPQKFKPSAGLQLIREIPSTPKPEMFEIRSHTIKNSPPIEKKRPLPPIRNENATPVFTYETPEPSPSIDRKSTPRSGVSALRNTTTKKGLKKNLTSFFEELIPFSKSRRKRVLPVP